MFVLLLNSLDMIEINASYENLSNILATRSAIQRCLQYAKATRSNIFTLLSALNTTAGTRPVNTSL